MGGWHKALVLVCWRRLLASRHWVWVLSPEDPPSALTVYGHSNTSLPGSLCRTKSIRRMSASLVRPVRVISPVSRP